MKIKIYIFTLWLQWEDDKETMKKWYKLVRQVVSWIFFAGRCQRWSLGYIGAKFN